MAKTEELIEKRASLWSELTTLDAQRRLLRDEMRILERETFELHHLRTQKDTSCPFCKRAFTGKVLDELLVLREEELEGVIKALDEVRERHAGIELKLVATNREIEARGAKGTTK